MFDSCWWNSSSDMETQSGYWFFCCGKETSHDKAQREILATKWFCIPPVFSYSDKQFTKYGKLELDTTTIYLCCLEWHNEKYILENGTYEHRTVTGCCACC